MHKFTYFLNVWKQCINHIKMIDFYLEKILKVHNYSIFYICMYVYWCMVWVMYKNLCWYKQDDMHKYGNFIAFYVVDPCRNGIFNFLQHIRFSKWKVGKNHNHRFTCVHNICNYNTFIQHEYAIYHIHID